MKQISKVSQLIRGLVVLVAMLHLVTVGLTFFNQAPVYAVDNSSENAELNWQHRADVSASWSGYAQELEKEGFNSLMILSGPELLFYLFIYFSLFNLFGRYRAGLVFDEDSISLIRRIGVCVFLWPLFTLVYPLFLTVTMRTLGLAEFLPISFAIGSGELLKLLTGLIVFVVGWIMTEARKLQVEQEFTI